MPRCRSSWYGLEQLLWYSFVECQPHVIQILAQRLTDCHHPKCHEYHMLEGELAWSISGRAGKTNS